MAARLRLVIPTRGPSPHLDSLLADIRREESLHPAVPITVVVTSGSSAAANRNRGAQGASEEWLQFLDDDVRLPTGWLDAVMHVIDSPGAPDLIGGHIGSLRPRNWFSQAAEDFVVRHKEYPEGWYVVSAHMTARRTAFEELGGFREEFGSAGGEDWDLCRRAHALGLRIEVTNLVRCSHANPTSWSGLSARARAYGAASRTLDATLVARPPVSMPVETTDEPGLVTSPPQRSLPSRALRWVATEYTTLRRLGRSRMRAARSTALYIPWIATYLRARSAHQPAPGTTADASATEGGAR